MTELTWNSGQQHLLNAIEIPQLKHDEAGILATAEAERIISLLELLGDDDWQKPTDCSEWNVREIVAHLAGAVASLASWSEFRRQNMGNPYMKEESMKIDAINRRQVEDRTQATNEALVAEFRENAPRAVRTRRRLPWLLRALRLPLGAPLGFASIGYLMDTIYTRDQWMHRHDIALATGREMVLTPEHDGRIVSLVIGDLGRKLKGQHKGRTIGLKLQDEAGGRFQFGPGKRADAGLELSVSTFNRLASGRLSAEVALAETIIEGDRSVALWFLQQSEVPY